jgi:two-component system response regulator RegA
MTTVLIVEDDAPYRRALARALSREGFVALDVEGVEEAIALLQTRSPDLAVVDLKLVDGSGIDVLLAIAERAPNCRTVLLTGFGSIPSTVEAMRAGAVDVRTKPISTPELVEVLRQAERGVADSQDPENTLGAVERDHILRTLEACGGNISATARKLGLHRRTLQRKLARISPVRERLSDED